MFCMRARLCARADDAKIVCSRNSCAMQNSGITLRGSLTVIFDRLALNVDEDTDRSHSALGCSFNSFSHCSWSRALYYSPLSFQPNPSLTIFLASSTLPLQTKTDTTSSFFLKAFEPILRHVLRDKMTPLYLVICFVTSYSRMTRLSTGN